MGQTEGPWGYVKLDRLGTLRVPYALLGEFRVGGGVHYSYTFQCGLVGSFTSPGIDTIYRRDRRILVSPPKDTGKAGETELPKFRSEMFSAVGFEPSTVRSPVERSNPLGYHAPPLILQSHYWLSV